MNSYNTNDVNGLSEEIPSEWREWIRFAKMDYDCACYLTAMPTNPKPYEIICYHCQQSAEKAVKALIVYTENRGGLPKVHDISFLLNQVKDILSNEMNIDIMDEIFDAAEFLTPYGIIPRYPSDMEIDDNDIDLAIQYTDLVINWVNNILDQGINK